MLDDRMLANLCYATEGDSLDHAALELAADDIATLANYVVEAWKRHQLNDGPSFDDDRMIIARAEFKFLFVRVLRQIIFPGLLPSDPRRDELVAIVRDLKSMGYPIELAYPPLLRIAPEITDEIVHQLRGGLVSLDEEAAKYAVWAVKNWMSDADKWGIAPPPSDLVHEIGLAISTRRLSNLMPALECVEWVIATASPYLDQHLLASIHEGMKYLLEEARYERSETTSAQGYFYEVSDIRAACVSLARTMSEKGMNAPIVEQWLSAGRSDPLWDVKNKIMD